MRILIRMAALVLMWTLFSLIQGVSGQAKAPGLAPSSEKPGDIERNAMGKVSFLVGEWQGEGWSLTRSGERERFWVKESYRYRGDRDLLDMEGRFGEILPDGTKLSEQQYALGILFYDRESSQYLMWHYGGDGTFFTARMEVDIEKRAAQYTRIYPEAGPGIFRLVIGEDGVWVTTVEILRPDQTRLRFMEFRMKRLTDFSGVWKFNPEKSQLQVPAPSSSAFVVDHQEPHFHLTRTHIYDEKPDTWSIDLTTDGKEVIQQEGDQTLRVRLYWEGNQLIFDSKIILKDREATNIVRYQLSEDGKTFTATESFRGPRLKYDNVWVFDRQE
jgi:hypothetical protein